MPVLATDANGQLTEAFGPSAVENIAAAGSAIANATAISTGTGLAVVTGADDTKGVVLPAAYPGKVVRIYNNQATNGLKVYAPVNSAINGGSANSAVVIEGKTLAEFVGTNATNYAGSYTANS